MQTAYWNDELEPSTWAVEYHNVHCLKAYTLITNSVTSSVQIRLWGYLEAKSQDPSDAADKRHLDIISHLRTPQIAREGSRLGVTSHWLKAESMQLC